MKTLLFIYFLSLSGIYKVNSLESISLNNVIVNYIDRGSETDYYLISNMKGEINVNNAWLAVALNSQTVMNGGVAIVCSNNNGISKIEHYYLNGNNPQLLDSNPTIGLKNIVVEINQGFLVCRFTRDNNFNRFIAQIDTGYAYMLVAYGPGTMSYHGRNRAATAYKIKIAEPLTTPKPFTLLPTTPKPTTLKPTTPKPSTILPTEPKPSTFLPTEPKPSTFLPTATNRPTSFSTFQPDLSGNYMSENFKLQWSNNNGMATDFILSDFIGGKPEYWVGMGFSYDDNMGDDSVVICKYFCTNGVCKGTAESRYNNGKNSELVLNSNPQFGLSNIRVLYENGRLSCSFTRSNLMANPRYFSATNRPYYLLNAQGPVDQNGNIYYHRNRASSSKMILFSQGSQTLPTITTGPFTTPSTLPTVTVEPISEVINKATQAILGFVNFLTRLFN